MPDISVIITTYNNEKYIGKAIQSVLDQTFKDFELIVVDDGSQDSTKELVSKFSDIRLNYVYQSNSGLPACARNKGIGLSRGKYIALLDGDDFWEPNKLSKCREVLDEQCDVDLVCHNEAIVYNDKVVRCAVFGPNEKDMYFKLLFKGNCLHPSAVMFRRRVFFDDGFKFSEDKNLCAIEDYEYWLRLSRRYRFHFLPDVLGSHLITQHGVYIRTVEANTRNMLRLLDSHFSDFKSMDRKVKGMIKMRRSSTMCAAGRMYSHMRDFKKSSDWYKSALIERPANYKAYVGLMLALLRIRVVFK